MLLEEEFTGQTNVINRQCERVSSLTPDYGWGYGILRSRRHPSGCIERKKPYSIPFEEKTLENPSRRNNVVARVYWKFITSPFRLRRR